MKNTDELSYEEVLAARLPGGRGVLVALKGSESNDRGGGLKYDDGKLRYSLVPPEALKGLAEVLTFGAKKYKPNSWQTVENAEERYLDALYRHLEAFRAGEIVDPESNLHHLKHALCNAAFLLHFEEQKDEV